MRKNKQLGKFFSTAPYRSEKFEKFHGDIFLYGKSPCIFSDFLLQFWACFKTFGNTLFSHVFWKAGFYEISHFQVLFFINISFIFYNISHKNLKKFTEHSVYIFSDFFDLVYHFKKLPLFVTLKIYNPTITSTVFFWKFWKNVGSFQDFQANFHFF